MAVSEEFVDYVVELLLNGDVRHGRRCPVPVLFAGLRLRGPANGFRYFALTS